MQTISEKDGLCVKANPDNEISISDNQTGMEICVYRHAGGLIARCISPSTMTPVTLNFTGPAALFIPKKVK